MDNVKIVTGNNVGVKLLGAFGQTTTGAGSWAYMGTIYTSFQAIVSGTGAVSATVQIQVSNDGINPITTLLATISPWKYVRANVTALTGSNVQVIMGN